MAQTTPGPRSAGSAERVVREHLAAFNDHDLDRLLACFTADTVWVTGADTVRGRVGLAELFEGAFAGLAPHLAVQTLLSTTDRVAVEMVERMTVDGVDRHCPIAGFYRVESGRIAFAKIYREGSADVADLS